MKRYCIGDLHGSYRSLKELLDTVEFNYENDLLIFLGDVTDGWSETKECLDLFMTIKNFVFIRGNHDQWVIDYYNGTLQDDPTAYASWQKHGGIATTDSLGTTETVDQKYVDFLNSSIMYYELEDRLFVHAGLPLETCTQSSDNTPLSEIPAHTLMTDRTMVKEAFKERDNDDFKWGEKFTDIYVGHTPTIRLKKRFTTPQNWGNIWLLDTGASFKGSTSIMDIDTEQIWQSTPSEQLYPDEQGRNESSWNSRNIQ